MSTFYVTTPIYYVNALPHIGHIFTTTVADTLARYQRLAGRDVHFLTGTDEHGQNIERAARAEGIEPIDLADRVVAKYVELRDRLDFSYDDFIRTTEERHRRGVVEIIRRIEAAGDFYTARHEGWYCPPCETFYTEKELGPEKSCPVHGTPVEWKSEENVFFRLSKYQQPLLDLYARAPGLRAAGEPPERGPRLRRRGAARPLRLARQPGVGDPLSRPPGPDGLRLARRPDQLHQRPGVRLGRRPVSTTSSGTTATSGCSSWARTSSASTPSTGRRS